MDREPRPPLITAGDTWSYTLDGGPSHTGAQGHVFFGFRSDGTPIAVKVAGQGAAEQALLNEIGSLRALAAAGVQGIVPVLDVVDVNGRPGMVMPRYRSTLAEWLDQVIEHPGEGTLDEILSKVATVARILAGVHAVSWGGDTLLHRDVKPENVFLDDLDRLVLGDFGGAMAITGLNAVELALFGSPMYAPLDQILPGRAIPDPTWDTYGLCVILYTALTGARPAYQSDPRSLLSDRGQDVWRLAQQAISATGPQAQKLRVDFAHARVGTTAHDLVNPVGKSALNRYDQELLQERVAALARLRGLPEHRLRNLHRSLWRVLTRGLSPLSHPSPPNRFRDAGELAEQLEELRDLVHPPSVVPSTPMVASVATAPAHDPPTRRTGARGIVTLTLVATVVLFAAALGAVLLRYPPSTWFAGSTQAFIPATTVILTHTRPPSSAAEASGSHALVTTTASPQPAQIDRIGVQLEGAARRVVVLANGTDGQPLARVDLGPRPPGQHLESWAPPDAPVTFEVLVEPAGIKNSLRVSGTATAKDDRLYVGGQAIPLASVVSWSGPSLVPSFRIDKTEVTEARWAACADAGVCDARPAAGTQHPVVGIPSEAAAQFCAFTGGRLPTEGEWAAAHGAGRYPWGDARPTCRHAHGQGCADTPQPVGSLPDGASEQGVLDLAGNAWEWVLDEDKTPILLGGSVDTKGGTIGRAARQSARGIVVWAGVRCAYNSAAAPDADGQ